MRPSENYHCSLTHSSHKFILCFQCDDRSITHKLHTAYWTLHTAHYTQHTAHYTLHTAHCILHTAHSTLRTAHCLLNIAHCTLRTANWLLNTAHCLLNSAHWTLHSKYCTLSLAHCTAPCPLNIAHCTLPSEHCKLPALKTGPELHSPMKYCYTGIFLARKIFLRPLDCPPKTRIVDNQKENNIIIDSLNYFALLMITLIQN